MIENFYSFRDVLGAANFGERYGWQSIQVVSSNRMELDNTIKRTYEGSIKVTVQSGDDPINSTGERAEVVGMFADYADENADSGTKYYGFSLYIPSGFTPPSLWGIALQLHGPDSYTGSAASPAFALDLKDGSYTVENRGGSKNSPTILRTDLGTIVNDKWVDFIFKVNWAADSSGSVAVWTRCGLGGILKQQKVSSTNTGVAVNEWNTPTLYQNGDGVVQNHYWKKGLYRNEEAFTNIIYSGRLCRADTLQYAALGAFDYYP